MNDNLKIPTIIAAIIVIAVASIAYGALTAAPQPTKRVASQTPVISKVDLQKQLLSEQPTITSVLLAAYPKIATDYTVNVGKLFDQGEWFGTTLTYRGSDTANRDTLRVLMQKKQGLWVLRTTPPRPLLSIVDFSDAPKSVLDAINQPISLAE